MQMPHHFGWLAEVRAAGGGLPSCKAGLCLNFRHLAAFHPFLWRRSRLIR
ncbi:hypothetical protein HMPREF9946_01320 [Acetobacteraceae bacterium AT-5844]|nr:hypothetical protein HMPREF9946_01320 [Acetobacteraceae bacterium AT-5844]